MLTAALYLSTLLAAADPEGVRPTTADGRPLNLDFETGDLRDWTATGDAFKDQPIEGDVVAKRRGDMKSRHQGKYWIGGWERGGDKLKGTLTSAKFKVTHPYASFLVGGGPHPTTRVEVVFAESNWVLHHFSGLGEEDLRRVVVDLRPEMGKEIYVRLVDEHSGHWGHINFDDFRFHSEKPEVPARPAQKEAPDDVMTHAGLTPEKAAQAMTVPEQFEVKLFAGEPDVKQPVAFCIDDRGRLWVAEAYTYPRRATEGQGKDRIVIFEDVDGDGKFDKRTVFMEGLNLVSGIEIGFGGVYVGAAPYFMHIPWDETQSKPAGPPKILLDGWAYEDTHETLNTFTWGPDGWLYGCHGVFTHSKVGKPGTHDKDRTRINAGVWRYHPVRHEFEVFAHGTSNPWGLAFDQYGQCFIEACVIPHCFHIIQGGRYERQAGSHFNPYTYTDIKTIADHLHYLGATPHGGNNRSDAAGGGHAHCGLMCYQGGLWPKEYHGKLFMGNIHGRRINMDVLKPSGSGYIASHGPDFLKANDAWARFINLQYGPDGNVYLIDWYDQQACHHNDPNIWDRSNGRIYKICLRGSKPVTRVDLGKLSDTELVNLQAHSNEWYARHARRLLHERFASSGSGKAPAGTDAQVALVALLAKHAKDEIVASRCVWTQHVLPPLSDREILGECMLSSLAPVRDWAFRLALDRFTDPIADHLEMAHIHLGGGSPQVRLGLASWLQRIPANKRWDLVAKLLSVAGDADDHNLPHMYWYAAEPLAALDAGRALALTQAGKIPLVHAHMVRRVSEIGTPEALAAVINSITAPSDDATRLSLLASLQEGLKGRRTVELPAGWSELFATLNGNGNAEIRSRALSLATKFGDPAALATLRTVLMDAKSSVQRRVDALDALVTVRDAEMPALLQQLVKSKELRSPALKALASFADAKTPETLLAIYGQLTAAEKRDALSVFVSRPPYAAKLLDAVAAKQIAATDIPAEMIRLLRNLKDEKLNQRLVEVWGVVRDTPGDRKKLIAEWRDKLATSHANDDRSLGRAVFAKACAQCHTLYGVGGKVGPDITGSNRSSLDYLLENMLDPSAVIPKDYAATKVTLANGRTLIGIVKESSPQAIVLATENETLTIPVSDIEAREPSELSMMPDDITKNYSVGEIRALVAYLRHSSQVPILATAENVKDIFNGKDLTGWDGNPKLWSVENGEIVGKSPGIANNEFLRSQYLLSDFRLSVKVKLTPNKENSGIQFRSEVLDGGEVKGPQADVGLGWWGKLYEEHGRGLLWGKAGDSHVKVDDWNDYVVEAVGDHVRTWINGQLCVDLIDPKLARKGILAMQIHAGGPMEVRYRDFKIELIVSKP